MYSLLKALLVGLCLILAGLFGMAMLVATVAVLVTGWIAYVLLEQAFKIRK